MALDLSFLDREQERLDLSFLDEQDSRLDLSFLNQPDPTLGQIGKGLATEIAVGEGGKFAGATAGAAIGSVVPGFGTAVGAGLGYVVGGLSGGISGSIAAQKLEGRDDISWGRVTADTILNLLPFGAGKVTKGAKVIPRLVGAGLKRGAQGAVIGTGAMSIEKGIEEGRTLTMEEFLQTAGTGAGLGIGLGGLSGLLNKSYSKLLNKSTDEIDNLYNKGDVDAITVVDALTGGNPVGRVNRTLNNIYQYVLPSKVIGNRAAEDVRRAVNEISTSREIAGRVQKKLDGAYKNLSDGEKVLVDKYIVGESSALPPGAVQMQDTIDEAREIIDGFSAKIIEFNDKGILNFGDEGDALIKTIKNNLKKGSYLTKEYRFYEDANYVPSQQARDNLQKSFEKALRKDGASQEEATNKALVILRQLDDSSDPELRASGARRGMNIIAENNRLFKRRKELGKEMDEFLGVYTTPGERFFGTTKKLGELVAQQNAVSKISDDLQSSGLAVRLNEIPKGFESSYETLKINKQVFKDGLGKTDEAQELYVPKQVNESIKQLFATGIPQDTNLLVENMFTKILSSTTGLTKFVKVPLAPAAYSPQLVGNAFMIAGQAMNPFRGLGKGITVAANEVTGKGLSLKDINRYKSLGLVDKEIFSSDIRNAFNKGYKLIPDNVVGKGASFATKKLGKVYSAIDTANRISVFENYQKQLRTLIPDIENKMSSPDIDKLAAELTNSTYQNYDRISPSLRYLSRVGVLNEFVSFNLELGRTTFNQARLAKSLINGSFAQKMKQEYDLDVNQGAALIEGGKRVAFLSGAVGAATAGIYAYNKANGFTDEEMNAIRETPAPAWDESSALLFSEEAPGKVGLTNMSYRMPIAELTSMFEAGLGTGSFTDAGGEIFQSFTDKFFGAGTMNAKNIINSLQNYNPKKGDKISFEEDKLKKAFDLGKFYIQKGYTPGIVKDIQKWDERTPKELGARYLLGERKFNIDILPSTKYNRFKNINDNLRGLRSAYTGAVKDDPLAAYQEYNETHRRNLAELVKHVNNLRILSKKGNYTEEEILDSLPQSLSKPVKQLIMQGKVTDMRIATSISGTKAERIASYVDQFSKLPNELGMQMLEQEIALGKIKSEDLNTIISVIKLKQGLKSPTP
tara:strand:- start:227 stop:3646 length:3420 start_codon:yes stop_codon:yes gene_type:complete